MPSDDPVDRATTLLAPAGETFRSAVARTAEEVRGFLDTQRESSDDRAGSVAAGLGTFASARIDPDRFSKLLGERKAADVGALARAEKALDLLAAIHDRGGDVLRVEVPRGGDLRDAVAGALAEAGRAFGAARMVEFGPNGSTATPETGDGAKSFPFRLWSRGERSIAPPLVVQVHGTDLHAGGLAEFMDGNVKVGLVVLGGCPPAPLARLVSPGVFVMQTEDPADLERLASAEGPGIAAVVPSTAALFVHDPANGTTLAERLSVERLPEEEPQKALGTLSARQQAEDLHHLATLVELRTTAAARPAPGAPGAAPAATPDPVDHLAGWLLQQADLSGIG